MTGQEKSSGPRRIAYLVNQYPIVSLAFIRREIHALESEGLTIDRFSIRHWDGTLVDHQDLAEQGRTRYLLDQGARGLLTSLARAAVRRPRKFSEALRTAVKLGLRSDRGLVWYLAYLAEASQLQQWLEERGVEHLHAHFASNPAAVAMLCRQLGGPTYSFTVHGPHDFDVAAVQGLDQKIGRAAFVAAISNYCRSQLCRWARFEDWNKIAIVHCGVDERYLGEPPPFDTSSHTLVCVGRLCEQKGQLLLVEAFARICNRHPEGRLVLVGDGEMRGAIEERIRRHRLGDRVAITGYQDSEGVYAALAGARALVLPSFAEGLPVVIMEAFAVGRPVISTYIAGIPELVTPGENGWLVAASDVDGLGRAMEECLTLDAATLAQMGAAGRARVLEQHDIVKEASRLRSLMQAATGVSADRPAATGDSADRGAATPDDW